MYNINKYKIIILQIYKNNTLVQTVNEMSTCPAQYTTQNTAHHSQIQSVMIYTIFNDDLGLLWKHHKLHLSLKYMKSFHNIMIKFKKREIVLDTKK